MIVLDCEMSGVDQTKHGIFEIGAIDLLNPQNRFFVECRIDDDHGVSADALAFNEVTEEEVRDPNKRSVKEALQALFDWAQPINDRTLVVQNFMDVSFLEVACEKYGLDFLSMFGYHFIDLHSVAYVYLVQHGYEVPNKNNTTYVRGSQIEEFTGIPAEPKPHKAINGALYEGEAFFRLVYKRNLFPEFAQFPLPEYLQ